MMYGPGIGSWGWGYGLMSIGMLLIWVLLLIGLVFVIRHRLDTLRSTTPSDQPPEPDHGT